MTIVLPTDLDLAKACAGTYEPSAVPQWQDAMKLVHVHLSVIDGVHVIAWEGTTDWQEWIFSDFMALSIPLFEHASLGPLHLGLARDVLSVSPAIIAYLENLGWPPYVNTGHSKGAGEALIFHGVMKERGHPPLRTRAFEPPHIGTEALRTYLGGEDIVETATHNHYGRDIVTLVPWDLLVWTSVVERTVLTVPDTYDIPTKHRIPAVIAALEGGQ